MGILDIFRDKLNFDKDRKKYYMLLEKILHRAVDGDIHYIVEANIYIELFIKSAYKVPKEDKTDLLDLIDEYISDNVLKSGLHKIRMNSNLIRHDEDYFEQYDDEKRLQYFKIIDAFTDYITMSKISKSYEVFSLVSRWDVFKKSLKNKIYNSKMSSINIEKIGDPFAVDVDKKYEYYLSSYTTEQFCLKILKLNRELSNECPPIFAVVHNIFMRKDTIKKSPFLLLQELNVDDFNEIHKYEFLILYCMKYGFFDFKRNNVIKVPKKAVVYVELAYKNIMYYAKAINNMLFEQYDLKYNVKIEADDYTFDMNGREIHYEFSNFVPSDARIEMWFAKKLKYKITDENKEFYLMFLKEFFGHENFREGQLEVVINILENDISNIPVAVFPTGYGKSLIFQYCALLQPQKTIVIVPTEILACDQIYNLNENGLNIGRIISSYTKDVNDQNGNLIFYAIPEVFLNSDLNKRLQIEDKNNSIFNIVLDECHNISLWGHQFEPTYFSLSKSIVNNFKNCNVTLFTATASKIVIDDIKYQFSNKKINIIQPVPLNRGHINYEFVKVKKIEQIYEDIRKLFRNNYGSNNNWNLKDFASDKEYKTLVINNDPEILDGLYNKLMNDELLSPYVSMFDDTVQTYKSFRAGNKKILLSNDDFVVGINIPELVNLICIGMPPSKEWLYQESGRVGRAYEKSNVVIYMQDKPSELFDMLMNSTISVDDIMQVSLDDKEINVDISNINYFKGYFQNKKKQLKYFDIVDAGVKENIYVVGKSDIGSVDLNFDYSERSEFDFLFYMLVLMGYVRVWLMLTSGDYDKVCYRLMCQAEFDLQELIDNVNKNITVTTMNVKIRNKYIDINNKSKDVKQLLGNLIDWYFDSILSIKREKIANTYDLLIGNNISSMDVEIDLAKYFDTSIENVDDLEPNTVDDVVENLSEDVNDTIDNIKEEYEIRSEKQIIEEIIVEEEKRKVKQDMVIQASNEPILRDNVDNIGKTSGSNGVDKLLHVLERIYDVEEIDFSFYDIYKSLSADEIYNLKYKLQKLLENGYIFGYEMVLTLIELESNNKELSRFKKFVQNANKDLVLLLLDKDKKYISFSKRRKAYKLLFSVYKPSSFKEWLMKLFG